MHPRAATLVNQLALQPHPEGGYFRETFRSSHLVHPADERDERAALTTIYFLLAAGQHSRWHRVRSDEVWHYYEGDELDLLWLMPGEESYRSECLGPVGETSFPARVVPAGCWQAARPLGAYTLVGCTVGPGFEFTDFELLADLPDQAEAIHRRFPELAAFI